MTTNTKDRDGGDRAIHKTSCCLNHIPISNRINGLIVRAALWGFMPVNLADWIIKRLHLENI